MKPPRPFRMYKKRGYSLCIACSKFERTNVFYAEGMLWHLCPYDYADYWENMDMLPSDFKDYDFGRHW